MLMKCTFSMAAILLLAAGAAAADGSAQDTRTVWRVTPAAGLDALLLIGAASGDVMQADIYGDEVAYVRDNLSADGLAALDALDAALRQQGMLTGPSLAYVFSAGPIGSIDDVIASAAHPVDRLKAGLKAAPDWNAEKFEQAVALMPTVHKVLVALRDMGYTGWYGRTQLPAVAAAVQSKSDAVAPFDIIPLQERLLGRKLEPRIEIIISAFTRPYGIRITGQRFVAYYDWETNIQLRVAAHELFHPPFDLEDPELGELLDELRDDPWMKSIVETHDPKFGYNQFMGVINEDSTQALDQIVATEFGFAKDPGTRWRESDGGMHMLAAALYTAMLDDGYAESGGGYSDWLKSALRRGLLKPERVRERATGVVGVETVAQWMPPVK